MNQLLAVTDLGRVRIFNFRPGGDDPQDKDHLVEKSTTELNGVGKPLNETVSDKAGRFAKTGAGGASGEEHNLGGEMERQAIARVAELVAEAVESEGCPFWTLTAPQAILKKLTDALPKACQDALANSLAADLTKEPVAKLEERFLS
ncbi:MAG: host attachment protein [Verrucomicrobiales bacterium]|nr:host attachment protein [Verrucomicrobiota bacterium JB025]